MKVSGSIFACDWFPALYGKHMLNRSLCSEMKQLHKY